MLYLGRVNFGFCHLGISYTTYCVAFFEQKCRAVCHSTYNFFNLRLDMSFYPSVSITSTFILKSHTVCSFRYDMDVFGRDLGYIK